LIATVPGVVFGLWGRVVFDDHAQALDRWLAHYVSFVPIFRNPGGEYGESLFDTGIVVGVMILPVITSLSREIMAQTPLENCEAALALGGTQWAMITAVIMPFARNGIIGATLLAFGRAMGETIAVVLILSPSNLYTSHLLATGGGSIAALIANLFTTSNGSTENALTLAGLALLVCTFAASLLGRAVLAGSVRRTR
jgi:phosphate transport system permease protein